MGFVQNVVGNVLVLGGGGGVLHCQPLAFKKIKKWRGKNRSVVKIKEVRNGMHDKYVGRVPFSPLCTKVKLCYDPPHDTGLLKAL